MYKVVYRTPRTFKKYDLNHIIGYLNETILSKYQPETDDSNKIEPYIGYQYEGSEVDGGTIMPCSNINNRDDLINAVIRSKYSESQEFAIQRHHQIDSESEAYTTEWESYTSFCEAAKIQVDKWL